MSALWIQFNDAGQPIEIELSAFPPTSKRRVIDLVCLLCTRPKLAGVDASDVTVHSPDSTEQYEADAALSSLAPNTPRSPLIVRFPVPYRGPDSTAPRQIVARFFEKQPGTKDVPVEYLGSLGSLQSWASAEMVRAHVLNTTDSPQDLKVYYATAKRLEWTWIRNDIMLQSILAESHPAIKLYISLTDVPHEISFTELYDVGIRPVMALVNKTNQEGLTRISLSNVPTRSEIFSWLRELLFNDVVLILDEIQKCPAFVNMILSVYGELSRTPSPPNSMNGLLYMFGTPAPFSTVTMEIDPNLRNKALTIELRSLSAYQVDVLLRKQMPGCSLLDRIYTYTFCGGNPRNLRTFVTECYNIEDSKLNFDSVLTWAYRRKEQLSALLSKREVSLLEQLASKTSAGLNFSAELEQQLETMRRRGYVTLCQSDLGESPRFRWVIANIHLLTIARLPPSPPIYAEALHKMIRDLAGFGLEDFCQSLMDTMATIKGFKLKGLTVYGSVRRNLYYPSHDVDMVRLKDDFSDPAKSVLWLGDTKLSVDLWNSSDKIAFLDKNCTKIAKNITPPVSQINFVNIVPTWSERPAYPHNEFSAEQDAADAVAKCQALHKYVSNGRKGIVPVMLGVDEMLSALDANDTAQKLVEITDCISGWSIIRRLDYEKLFSGKPGVVLISGAPGVGKSLFMQQELQKLVQFGGKRFLFFDLIADQSMAA